MTQRQGEPPKSARHRQFCVVLASIREGDEDSAQWPPILILEDSPGGSLLLAYASDGSELGDTWHETRLAADQETREWFGQLRSSWELIPETADDPVAYAVQRAPTEIARHRAGLDARLHEGSLASEPRGDTYVRMLEHAAGAGVLALLVVPDPADLADHGREVLTGLNEFIVRRSSASEWDATRLATAGARVYHYELEDACVGTLVNHAEGLFEWRSPALPEDLSFTRTDGSTWLATSAQRREARWRMTDAEREALRQAVPELG